jgi:hypothetical protein
MESKTVVNEPPLMALMLAGGQHRFRENGWLVLFTQASPSILFPTCLQNMFFESLLLLTMREDLKVRKAILQVLTCYDQHKHAMHLLGGHTIAPLNCAIS